MASFAGSARPPFGALLPIDGKTTRAYSERTICCRRTPLRCGRSPGLGRRLRRPPAWPIRPEADRDRLLAMESGHGAARPGWLPSRILVAVDRARAWPPERQALSARNLEARGWLAPRFRAYGLGPSLSPPSASSGRDQLAIASVRAGTQSASIARPQTESDASAAPCGQ
jgi:hypothetical protein